MYISLSLYIYIYIYLNIHGRNRFGSVRFGSGLVEKSSFRFGSVWQMLFFSGSMRFGLHLLNASWFGSDRFGSVWPVRFGFLIPS